MPIEPAPLRLTALVTAHDRRAFLAAAVRSALEAGADEVVVVRNFDTPLEGLEGRYRNVPCAATETCEKHARGVEEARGELIAFLDDDDLWLPEKVPYVRARFAARPELAYLCHAHRAIDVNGAPVDAHHPELADKDPSRFAAWDGRDFETLLRSIWPGNNSSMVVRAAWARGQVPLLRASGWSSDLAWLVAALSSGAAWEIDPAALSLLRLHDQNMSQTRGSGPAEFRERHRIASDRFARANAALARIARERGQGPPNMASSLAARAEGLRFFADLEGARHPRRAAWRALRDRGARQDRAVRGAALVALASPGYARHLLYRSSQRRWALARSGSSGGAA